MTETTIAALATPPAPSGLGVIRISGPEAHRIAARVFTPIHTEKSIETAKGYTALYGTVSDTGGTLDDCVALVFHAPHSYTGEDVVELSCHGGLYLLQRVLRACLDAGAVPAAAGEFTRRAFLNGKMDLSGAEAVMSLIGAEGDLSLRTALATREGAVFRRMNEVGDALIAVNAAFSAYVDYPDEDIPELEPQTLEHTLETSAETLRALLATFDAGKILREGIQTVIAGAPNVGKSTLMNALSGYDRSIVTPIPGTTRDVVEETVRLGEITLRLADTAGIRETEDTVEKIGVDLTGKRLAAAALVLAVFDGSRALTQDDETVIAQIGNIPAIAIINKSDKKQEINSEYIKNRFSHVVFLSAQTGEGMEALSEAVEQITGVCGLDAAQPVLATERQRQCAMRCLQAITEALETLRGGITPDAVSVLIDEALEAVLALTGKRVSEAVLEEIFSRFCVGK